MAPRLEELLLSLLTEDTVEGEEAEASIGGSSPGGGEGTGAGGDSIPRWAALLLRLTVKLNR